MCHAEMKLSQAIVKCDHSVENYREGCDSFSQLLRNVELKIAPVTAFIFVLTWASDER